MAVYFDDEVQHLSLSFLFYVIICCHFLPVLFCYLFGFFVCYSFLPPFFLPPHLHTHLSHLSVE